MYRREREKKKIKKKEDLSFFPLANPHSSYKLQD